MKPFSTPLRREEIEHIACKSIRKQAQEWPDITTHIGIFSRLVSDLCAKLPDEVPTKKQLSNRAYWLLPNVLDEGQKQTDVSLDDLEMVKKGVCRDISLVMYRQYIEQCLTQRIIPYCEEHEPPSKWGMGSVFYWSTGDEHWGRTFYSFWRQCVEKSTDTAFRTLILPQLPQSPKNWRERYELVLRTRNCPYDWKSMTPQDIANVLLLLKKIQDPAITPWGIGSIPNQWIGENGELFGKSFWHYWRKYKEGAGEDNLFQEIILPLLPETWQKNYRRVGSSEWASLSDATLAERLSGLHRLHGLKKWGLGSVQHWEDQNGNATGRYFHNYWWAEYGDQKDAEFERRILPLMSEALRVRYKPVGYEIPFLPETPEQKMQAAGTNDLDELHRLAAAGSRPAFLKLKDELRILVDEQHPETVSSEILIERIIHMHLPVLGGIRKYALRSMYLNGLAVIDDDENRTLWRQPKSHEGTEDSLLARIDIRRDIRRIESRLQDCGISHHTILALFDVLLFGKMALHELAATDGDTPDDIPPEVIKAAQKLVAIISDLRPENP